MLLGEFGRPRRHQIPQQILQLLNSFKFLLLKMYVFFTLSILYCSKRQKDKTQAKQLRRSSPNIVYTFIV
jgi:hypothetical protein